MIGQPLSRVDGRAKVTGAAKYSYEEPVHNAVYAVMVTSTIAAGRVASIDSAAARALPGVIAVLTHENAPRVKADAGDRKLKVLQDAQVFYDRQPVALVVADTFERAVDAAAQVRVAYDRTPPATTMESPGALEYKPETANMNPPDTARGDFEGAFAAAPVKLDNRYVTPTEFHNPMEPHATIALLGRRPADPLRRLARRVRAARQHRQAVRHPGERRAGRRQVHRRRVRLQGRHQPAPRAGGDGGPLRRPPGQDRADPAADVRRARQPAAHRAARPDRRRPRRQAAGAGARRALAGLALRRLHRERGGDLAHALRGRQPGHDPPRRAPRHRHADLHARARRVERVVRAGVGDGRAGLRGRRRPAAAAADQLRRDRSAREEAVVVQVAAAVLRAGRRALRLGAAHAPAALDALARGHAGRHGDGDRDVPLEPLVRLGQRDA